MTKRISRKVVEFPELCHGKHLWDMSYESGSTVPLREEFRELLRLAMRVIVCTYDEQEKAISELENFLR